MRDGTRAARSAALLAGFLLLAWLQVAVALLVVLLVLGLLPGWVALRVGAPVCIAAAGLWWFATSQALRVRRTAPAGVPVSRTDAPALWAMVDAAAAAAAVPPPDAVLVIADARAALYERSRLLGLLGGRREFHLGLPLLQAWDVPRLRAVTAHELAHGSSELGRWAPVAYRGRLALGRIVPRIPRRSPIAPALLAWAGWFRRVDEPLARAHELAADRIAAGFAGAAALAAVLRDGPALEGMQRLFHAEYLSPGWQAGYVPDDLFGGFLRVLAARPDELDRLRALPPEPAEQGDPHPPLADRLAALTDLPPGEPADPGAPVPVPDLPGLGRALQAVAFPPAGRTVVGWDEFFTVARNAELEREADPALRAIGRAAGTPVSGLADVLDLVADGRLAGAADVVFGGSPHAETAERVLDLVTLLLAVAALDSGVARWRHSWTGTAELVTLGGGHLDLVEAAALASDPTTVHLARRRLAELGIDPSAAPPAVGRRALRVPVLGGLLHLLVDGVRTDLLLIETGFVLITSLPRFRADEGRQRLVRLAAGGIRADGSSAEVPVEGHRFVPYADVVAASVPPARRRRCDLTLADGSTLSVRAALDADELPGGWAAFEEAVAFLADTRTADPAAGAVPPPTAAEVPTAVPTPPAAVHPVARPSAVVPPLAGGGPDQGTGGNVAASGPRTVTPGVR